MSWKLEEDQANHRTLAVHLKAVHHTHLRHLLAMVQATSLVVSCQEVVPRADLVLLLLLKSLLNLKDFHHIWRRARQA
jgi:hypothetical protein